MGRQAKIKAARRKARLAGKVTAYDVKQVRHENEYAEQLARQAAYLRQIIERMERENNDGKEEL